MSSMSDVIKAKRALYKAIKELKDWGNEEGMWRDYALCDYDEAITKMHALLFEIHGERYANVFRMWVNDTVKKTICNMTDDDIAMAKLHLMNRDAY